METKAKKPKPVAETLFTPSKLATRFWNKDDPVQRLNTILAISFSEADAAEKNPDLDCAEKYAFRLRQASNGIMQSVIEVDKPNAPWVLQAALAGFALGEAFAALQADKGCARTARIGEKIVTKSSNRGLETRDAKSGRDAAIRQSAAVLLQKDSRRRGLARRIQKQCPQAQLLSLKQINRIINGT
jgi:hypothetical protein